MARRVRGLGYAGAAILLARIGTSFFATTSLAGGSRGYRVDWLANPRAAPTPVPTFIDGPHTAGRRRGHSRLIQLLGASLSDGRETDHGGEASATTADFLEEDDAALDSRVQGLIDRLVTGLRARSVAMAIAGPKGAENRPNGATAVAALALEPPSAARAGHGQVDAALQQATATLQMAVTGHQKAAATAHRVNGAAAAAAGSGGGSRSSVDPDVERLRRALSELQAEKKEYLIERETELEYIEDMTAGQLEMRRALAALDVDLRRSMTRLRQAEKERDAAKEGLEKRSQDMAEAFGAEREALHGEVVALRAAVGASQEKRQQQQQQIREYQQRMRDMATELSKAQASLRQPSAPLGGAAPYFEKISGIRDQREGPPSAAAPPGATSHQSLAVKPNGKDTVTGKIPSEGVPPGGVVGGGDVFLRLQGALSRADRELEHAAKLERERGEGSMLAQAHAAFRRDNEDLKNLLDVERKQQADAVAVLQGNAEELQAGAARVGTLQEQLAAARQRQAELKASVSALGLQLGSAKVALEEAENQRGMEEVLRKAADEKLERERQLRTEQTASLVLEVKTLRISFERQKEAYEENMTRLQKELRESATAIQAQEQRAAAEATRFEEELATAARRLAEERARYDAAVPVLREEITNLQQHVSDMETRMGSDAKLLQGTLEGSQRRAAALADQVEQMRGHVLRLESERASVKHLLGLLGRAAAAHAATVTAGPAAAARATAAAAFSWRPPKGIFGRGQGAPAADIALAEEEHVFMPLAPERAHVKVAIPTAAAVSPVTRSKSGEAPLLPRINGGGDMHEAKAEMPPAAAAHPGLNNLTPEQAVKVSTSEPELVLAGHRGRHEREALRRHRPQEVDEYFMGAGG